MAKSSAGILMYRTLSDRLEVLLVHPGGPFFKNKDAGAWSIPKGELTDSENGKDAAIREFEEELGVKLQGDMRELVPVVQKGGKKVQAWAIAGDLDTGTIACNTFSIEWPPRSGRMQEFPEIDQARWFSPEVAREKINPAQIPFIEELMERLRGGDDR